MLSFTRGSDHARIHKYTRGCLASSGRKGMQGRIGFEIHNQVGAG